MDPKIVKKTQDSLGKIIKKPPLTEKLLGKPPFRFLHDVVTSVIKTTGFMKGLYEEAELNSENVKEKEGKIAFLQKAIDMVVAATGNGVPAKPAKIVAGHEPERTNEFLQLLAAAINANVDNDDCVKKVLSGAAGGGGGEGKKEEKREKDKERTRSASRKKDEGDKHKKEEKEKSHDREKDRDKKHRDRSEGREDKDKERHRDRREKSRDREERHRDKDKDRERRKKPTEEKPTGEGDKEKQSSKTSPKTPSAETQSIGSTTEAAVIGAVKSKTVRKTEQRDKSVIASGSGSGISPNKDKKEVGRKKSGMKKTYSAVVKESNSSPQKTQSRMYTTSASTPLSPEKVKTMGISRIIPRAGKVSEKSSPGSSTTSSPQKSPEKRVPDGPSKGSLHTTSSHSVLNPDRRGLGHQRSGNRQDNNRVANKQSATSVTKQTSSPALRIAANSKTLPKKPLKAAVSSPVLAAKQLSNKRLEQVKATSQSRNRARPGQPPGQQASKQSSRSHEDSASVPDLGKQISSWTAGGKENGGGEEAAMSNILGTDQLVGVVTPQEKELEEKENESPEQNGEKESQQDTPSRLQRPNSAKGSRRRRQGREARDDDDEEFQQKEKDEPAISEHDLPPQVTAARKMARPPSARPAPPRPKQEGVDQEPAMRLGTGAPTNLIVDDGKQSDDEDENFLVEESAPPPPTTFNDTAATQGDAEDDAEHGALVKKMLESKKDAEQQQQPTKKTEIERPALSDAQRRKQRELVAKEIERLQTSIQSLTRSANPLGKIMDYVQEDMDSMQKELDRWRTENKEHALALRREKNVTDRAIEPLKAQLTEVDRAISDQLDLIAACKSNIIRNDQRTQKMLQSIARS